MAVKINDRKCVEIIIDFSPEEMRALGKGLSLESTLVREDGIVRLKMTGNTTLAITEKELRSAEVIEEKW